MRHVRDQIAPYAVRLGQFVRRDIESVGELRRLPGVSSHEPDVVVSRGEPARPFAHLHERTRYFFRQKIRDQGDADDDHRADHRRHDPERRHGRRERTQVRVQNNEGASRRFRHQDALSRVGLLFVFPAETLSDLNGIRELALGARFIVHIEREGVGDETVDETERVDRRVPARRLASAFVHIVNGNAEIVFHSEPLHGAVEGSRVSRRDLCCDFSHLALFDRAVERSQKERLRQPDCGENDRRGDRKINDQPSPQRGKTAIRSFFVIMRFHQSDTPLL